MVILILILPIIAGVVQYFRVQGFKNTLETLVTEQSNGAYELTIGKTEIQFLDLSFSLKDIAVSKVSQSDSSGVLQVKSDQLLVDIGSPFSMLSTKQFKIDELSITEPIAIVGLSNKKEKKAKRDPVNIAHEIAQFAPALESLLNQFDIKLFHIDRAALNLEQEQNVIEVRVMDLLVSDWNMRSLSDEASLRLTIGSQAIEFNTTQFSFSAIEYDYLSNELHILDYDFAQRDSLDRDVVNASGESLQVINLDFESLIGSEHYILEQLAINHPSVVFHIYPHEKKQRNNIKYPISNLLKRNLRELQVMDCLVKDARVEVNVYGEQDTLYIDLPELNLELKELVVTEDSSVLMIQGVNLELGKTILEPGGPLSLGFSKLIYDEDYYVEIDSIRLLDKETGKELINTEEIKLYNFNFFDYFIKNDLYADSVILKNGQLNTNHGAPRLKAKNPTKQVSGKRKEPPTIHIGKVKLDEIDLNLDFGKEQLVAKKITAIVENLAKDQGTNYYVRNFGSTALSYHDPEGGIDVSLLDVIYRQNSLNLGKMDGQYEGLSLSLDGAAVNLTEDFDLDGRWHHQLRSVELGSIKLTGSIPEAKKTEPEPKPGPKPELEIQKMQLDQFHFDLSLPDSGRFFLDGANLLTINPQLENGKFKLDHLEMDIVNASFDSETINLETGASWINSDSISQINHLNVETGSEDVVNMRELELGPWRKGSQEISMDYLVVSQLEFRQAGGDRTSTSDSIRLNNITWKEQEAPRMDLLRIYAPDLYFKSKKEKKEGKSLGTTIAPLNMFGQIDIYPGQVTIDNKAVTFEQIKIYGEEKDIDIGQLAFVTPSTSIHIGRIQTTAANLNIDSITIIPRKEFVEQIKTEQDVVAGQLYNIQIREVDWEMLADSNKLIAGDVFLNGFDISLRRDKTLPDPPEIYKPHLLSQMFPDIPNLSIPRITVKGGNISYFEVGEKMGRTGQIKLNDLNATINRYNPLDMPEQVLQGTAMLYDQGKIHVDYQRLDSFKFALKIRLVDFPLEAFNQMVDPLEAAKIRDGYLSNYEFEATGDSIMANGHARISYNDLHVRIFKVGEPEEKSLGSELLTLVVDGIVLKHNRKDAVADFTKERVQYKGPVNYWVKIAIQAAVATIMKGKKEKKQERKRKRKSSS